MQLATITLIVQILFYLVLCAGVAAQLMKRYKWHDRLQTPVVVLNIFFIIFVMLPTFGVVVFGGEAGPVPTAVTAIHGLLGTVAQGLAIYCLLAGFKILPRRIGVLRYWMWATFVAWTAAVIFGVGVYIVFYAGDSTALSDQAEIVGEHDADLIADLDEIDVTETEEAAEENPALTEESVSEHAEAPVEDLVENSAEDTIALETTEPDAASPDEAIAEHAEEVIEPDPLPSPTEEPTGEPVDEHAEELIAPDALPEEGPADGPADGPMVDTGADTMEAIIAEHAAVVPAVEEPEFIGELGFVAWERLNAANQGPGPRYEHAMQYNQATNQIFLFGGRDGNQIYNDVWSLDVETLSWRQLAVDAAVAPPARFSTVMIVDENAENLYVATGHTQGGQSFNDVWKLDLATETWTDLTGVAGTPPEARYGGPGGNFGGDLILTHGFGSTRYDDTWRFNTDAEQWEDITPTGPLPLKRCLFAATPAASSSLVIHGGCATPFGDCFLDDTWLFDTEARSWREIVSDVKPVGRQYQTLVSAVSSTGAAKVILFGGQDASRAARSDAWILDIESGEWTLVDSQDGPAARYNHAAVWVPGFGMMMYGGRNESGALDDLWYGNF